MRSTWAGLGVGAQRLVEAVRHDRVLLVVGAVFLAGLGLRLWFVAAWRPAFLGFTDAGGYVGTAHGAGSPVRPIGYPIFLKVIHELTADMTWTIVLQHALGLASAALLYLAIRRIAGSRLIAIVPATFVLFDGAVVVLEHTLLTETLFIFLVAGSSYATVRSLDGSPRWAAAAGGFAAAAGVTRSVGLLLVPIPVLAVLLWRRGHHRARLATAGLAGTGALGVIVIYLGIVAAAPGNPAVTISPSSGRVLYSRVAPFADCGKFDPPAGTRALCETLPASFRAGTNDYLHIPGNPAWRLYGPPPAGDGELRAFALAAIRHQLGDYVSAVWQDLRLSVRDHNTYVDLADDNVALVTDSTRRYYSNPPGFSNKSPERLLSYARSVFTAGRWPMLLLIVVPAVSLVVTRGRERHGAAIFAVTGWVLLVGGVATTDYDPRYGVVAIGSLAAGAAPALAPVARRVGWLIERLRGRRAEATRTSR